MTTKSTENSPEFSPSILQNQRGPLRPSATSSQQGNPLKPILPAQVNRLFEDKRAVAVMCLFLPPLAVFLKTGVSKKFGLSLILFAFFIFPGIKKLIFIYYNIFIFICVGIIYAFYVNFLESALNSSDNVYEV